MTSSPPALNCPRCSRAWGEDRVSQKEIFTCEGCASVGQIFAWPALLSEKSRKISLNAAAQGEASCYNHSNKQANQSCEVCGRFICDLCDLDLDEKHQCPRCATGEGSNESRFEMRRFRWDMASLGVSVLSFIVPFLFVLSAPAVIYLVVRHWRQPMSVAEDKRHQWAKYLRFFSAFVIALLQLALTGSFILNFLVS